MKKQWILLIITALVLVVGAVAAIAFFRKPSAETPKPTPTPPPEKVNTIPIEERPYVQLAPSANGRNITLTVGALKKDAAEGEYEIDYLFGDNLQNGAFGMIQVEDLPGAEYDILLGSCSAGGKCSYDEGVIGGSLLLRFEDPEKYVLKNEWAFIDNTEEESSIFVSRDAKFRLEAKSLASVGYGIILQSPGLPAEVESALLSDPYAVALSTTARGPFTVSIRLKEAAPTAQMLGWDGTAWEELETTVEEKMAEAEATTLYDAYVVVQASE